MKVPRYITFDCYGTLVDFQLNAVSLAILGDRITNTDAAGFVDAFERIRFREVLGPFRPYHVVLRESLQAAMDEFGLEYLQRDGDALVAAVPGFGPFPEVPGVLRQLAQHTNLVIVTNSDNNLIPGNIARIGAPIHRVITSEDVGAYKPSTDVFEYVLRELDCDASDILHVAQGFDYDIVPAHAVGWDRVWINRRGLPGDPSYGPYHELPDLTGLPGLIGLPASEA